MHPLLGQLVRQAGLDDADFPIEDWDNVPLSKFAQLIVQECAGLCNQAAEESARTFYTVTETKEVGPALVAKGSQVQAEKLSKQIREHFGVEE